MKILHVIAQLPSKTGSGVYYSNVLRELAQYGHEQAALFAVQDDLSFDAPGSSQQYPVRFKTDRLPFPIAGMSDVMPYPTTIYAQMDEPMLAAWYSAFSDALLRAKQEFRPDAIILHHLWMLTSLAIDIFPDQPKLAVCHNTDIRQAEQHPELKNNYVANLHALDAVFSLSDGQQQTIADVFGIARPKIITLGGGFDQELFFPATAKPKNAATKIIFAAKIEKSKGVFELVKAFKKVSATNPHLQLDIIGQPNEANTRTLTELIGGAGNISIVPIQCQKALASYVREADIFVMPSYFEGLGLVAIECLASGLRVVATEIDALIQLLGSNVNRSGVIEYVPLPRVYDTDKPVEEDLEAFVDNLAAKLRLQIARVEAEQPFPPEILDEISQHSWGGLVARMNDEITRLAAGKAGLA